MFFEKILSLEKDSLSQNSQQLVQTSIRKQQSFKQSSDFPITMTFGHDSYKNKVQKLKQALPFSNSQKLHDMNIQLPVNFKVKNVRSTQQEYVEDLYSTPTLKYCQQQKSQSPNLMNSIEIIDIQSQQSLKMKNSSQNKQSEKNSLRYSQQSIHQSQKDSKAHSAKQYSCFLLPKTQEKSQYGQSHIAIDLENQQPKYIKQIPIPSESNQVEDQDQFDIKQTQQAIESKIKELNELRMSFKRNKPSDEKSSTYLKQSVASNKQSRDDKLLLQEKKELRSDIKTDNYSYFPQSRQLDSKTISEPSPLNKQDRNILKNKSQRNQMSMEGVSCEPQVSNLEAQSKKPSITDSNRVTGEQRSYLSDKKYEKFQGFEKKPMIEVNAQVGIRELQKKKSQGSIYSMPLSTNSHLNKQVLRNNPLKSNQKPETVRSKTNIQEMVQRLKRQLNQVKNEFNSEKIQNANIQSPFKSINDECFVDYQSNQISEIKMKEEQVSRVPQFKNNQITGKISQDSSLIQYLTDENQIEVDSFRDNKIVNKQSEQVKKEGVSGLKQKQNSKLQITPSFKPHSDSQRSLHQKDILNDNISLTSYDKRTDQTNLIKKYTNTSDISKAGTMVSPSITEIIARQSPNIYPAKITNTDNLKLKQSQLTRKSGDKIESIQEERQKFRVINTETSHQSLQSTPKLMTQFKPPSIQECAKAKTQPKLTKQQILQPSTVSVSAQQLQLKQVIIKNLSLQLYNERQRIQKLEEQVKILSVQKATVQVSKKLEESLQDFMMNNSGLQLNNNMELNSNAMGQIISEFKNLKKQVFSYQQYIFDLQQENVKLKQSREEEFTKMRANVENQYNLKFNATLQTAVCQQLSKRLQSQTNRINQELEQKNLRQSQKAQQQLKQQLKSQKVSQIERGKRQIRQELQKQLQEKQLRSSQKQQRQLQELRKKNNQIEQIHAKNLSLINKLKSQLQEQKHKQEELLFQVNQSKNQIIQLTKEMQEHKSQIEQLQMKVFCLQEELLDEKAKRINISKQQYLRQSQQSGTMSSFGNDKYKKSRNVNFKDLTSFEASQQQNSIIHNLDNFKTENQIPSDPKQKRPTSQKKSTVSNRHHEIHASLVQLQEQLVARQIAIKQAQFDLYQRQKQLISREQSIYKLQLKVESDMRKLQMKQASLELEEKQIMEKYQEIRRKEIHVTQQKFGLKQIERPLGQYGLRKLNPSVSVANTQKLQKFQPMRPQMDHPQRPEKDVQSCYETVRRKSIYDRQRKSPVPSIEPIVQYEPPRYNPMLNASRTQRSRSNSIQAQKILSKMKAQGSITKKCKCNYERNMCVCKSPSNSYSNQVMVSANRPVKISPPNRPSVQQAHRQLIKDSIQSSYYVNSNVGKINSPRVASKKDTPIHTLQHKMEDNHKSMKLKIIEDKVKRIKSEAGLNKR